MRLVDLAAEADQEGARDIGVAEVTAQRAPQDRVAGSALRHSAAEVVRERDDAVEARCSFVQGVGAQGDHPGHRGGAVHGRDDDDVVPGGRASVGPAVAEEVVAGGGDLSRRGAPR